MICGTCAAFAFCQQRVAGRSRRAAEKGAPLTVPAGAGDNGFMFFEDKSTADHATILVNKLGELSFAPGFFTGGTATAGFANITNNGVTNFFQGSTAGNATITTNTGGLTNFFGMSTGGNAAFITNAGGVVDISGLGTFPDTGAPPTSVPGMTAGSIAGAGNYFLGSKSLTVGSNNLSTEVSGTISDGGSAGGTGGSLVKVGTGTLTLSGVSTYTGPTTISAGAINLTGSLVSPVSVEAAGTLGSIGTVFNTVTNAGTVAPGLGLPAGQFGALTVNNYVGAGGTLALRTFLDTDGSASDLLTINGGTATGSTGVRITNAGGGGALTAGNGILVVGAINGGTTAPGAFSLAGTVEAGAFSYLLFRGSVDASGPQNWYLRSTLTCSLTPTAPQCMPPVTGGGGEGGGTPTPGPVIPDFRPAVPLYAALSPLATQYGFSSLGTLHERMGDPYATVDPAGRAPAAPAAPRSISRRCRPRPLRLTRPPFGAACSAKWASATPTTSSPPALTTPGTLADCKAGLTCGTARAATERAIMPASTAPSARSAPMCSGCSASSARAPARSA
jgi:autotransporter-associated beta strand protein